MTFRSLVFTGLILGLSSVGPAHAHKRQTAGAATIDWAARACSAEQAFGFRFGERPPEPGHRLLDETRHPFPRLTLGRTERSGRLFRVDTVGMFPASPGSTQSDREAGRILFEAVDARIVELGLFASRERAVDEDGDIDIIFSNPTDGPDSGVVLEVSLMLGGVWMSCVHQGLKRQHVEEVLR